MSNLINRQDAIEAYGDWYVEEGPSEGFIGTVKQLLEGLPSAEPERKTGKWEPFSPKSHLYSCSLCGQWADRHWNYCPNCGARMEADH